MSDADYTIYTDGGSRGNPGIAGAGAVIKDASGKTLKEVIEPLGEATNNFAEYSAVLVALDALRKVVKKAERKSVQIEVKMDSELVRNQLSAQWKLEEETLWPIYMKIHNILIEHFPNVKFTHVRREQNQEADRLANLAMDQVEGSLGQSSLI